jgi:hypothetical protein
MLNQISIYRLAEYFLIVWAPIGPTQSMFSVPGLLLVPRRVYSQHQGLLLVHTKYIISAWPPIGPTQSILSSGCLLLVPQIVYSPCLASYWSHASYRLCSTRYIIYILPPGRSNISNAHFVFLGPKSESRNVHKSHTGDLPPTPF